MNALHAFWQKLFWMVRKELLATLNDPRTRYILVMPPLVQSLLFGYVATYDLDLAPYAVLDMSHSRESADFLARLDGSAAFQRVRTLGNTHEIADCIDSGEAMLVISIPPDFADKLSSGSAAPIQVITDGRNTMTASAAGGYVGRIAAAYNSERNPKVGVVSLESIFWYNPNLITRWTFLPALMGMLSFVQVLMLGGLSVAREREQGTFDQLLVTPLSPAEILIGKAVIPVVVGIFQATLVFLICRNVFSIPFAGNLMSLYAVLLVFTLSISGLGLSISAISNSMQQVMVYCFVLILPMVLLSGFATPVANMPEVLQILTYADPLRFALDSLRRIYLEGCPISDVVINFVPMMILAAITLPLAAYLFRNKIS